MRGRDGLVEGERKTAVACRAVAVAVCVYDARPCAAAAGGGTAVGAATGVNDDDDGCGGGLTDSFYAWWWMAAGGWFLRASFAGFRFGA